MNEESIYPENSLSKDSILTPEEIQKIRQVLGYKPRDLLLFNLALQTGMKIKDLLNLKVKDLDGIGVGEKISVPGKNKKYTCTMDEIIRSSYSLFIANSQISTEDYIFKQKKASKPLTESSVSVIIRGWFNEAQLKNSHGAMSLRRTSEYLIRKNTQKNSAQIDSNSMDLFVPIKTQNTQEIVYDQLSKAMISGKIPPGTRLTIAGIAKAFNVSHAPVRVALNWLEAKNFITVRKKKASIVNRLSIEELKEIMELRQVLEIHAIKATIKMCSEETLSRLESIIKLEEKAKTLEEISNLNAKFHQTLYRDTNKPILRQLLNDFGERISPYILLDYSKTAEGRSSSSSPQYTYHQKILDSIRRKDLKDARKYVRLDLSKRTGSIENILGNRAYEENELKDTAISKIHHQIST